MIKATIRLLKALPSNTRATLLTSVCGIAAGLVAVAFLLSTNWVYRVTLVALSHQSRTTFLLGSLGVITVSSWIVGFLLARFQPKAAGSGIPELKVAYWKDLGFLPFRSVWVKFVAGVLSLGGGASLGREGPTVFVSGGVATNLAGRLGVARQNQRPFAAAGAAAGLAAAFNTPMAAITFVLEELLGELSNRVIGSVVLASVIGAFVVYATLGKQPAFDLPTVGSPSLVVYLFVPIVAILGGAIGMLFQRASIQLRGKIRAGSRIPPWLRPWVGGLTTWALGSAVFLITGRLGVFSLGYDDLSEGLRQGIDAPTASLLVVCKLAATVMCYGWAGCGGIFSPTLFLGAMTGIAVAGFASPWVPLTHADYVILATVGMSACFGAVVRAPLTALLIVFEMTHQFALVPALMLAGVISQPIARAFGKHNFYDAILEQDGHELMHVKPPRDLESWRNLPVSTIAKLNPLILHDLSETSIRGALLTPYGRFPVELDGGIKGVLLRPEVESALKQGRTPQFEPAVMGSMDMSIRDISHLIINSPSGLVILTEEGSTHILGLVTLHDLLRAQVDVSE